MAGMPSVDEVEEALANVIDPELGLDFVELGLVYEIEVDGGDVHITFTLTSPGCPIGPQVTEQMKEFKLPKAWGNPYDVVPSKGGAEVWTGSMSNDYESRLDTKSGEITEYLLPRSTNWPTMNLPLYSPTAPARGRKPG